MIGELTFFRCYWPQVFRYLKDLNNTNFKCEAFGLLMTLDLQPEVARKIMLLLPLGSVTDYVELASTDPMTDEQIDEEILGL